MELESHWKAEVRKASLSQADKILELETEIQTLLEDL